MVHVFVKVGPKGQIVIPQEFREEYHIVPGEKVLLEDNKAGLIVKPAEGTDLIKFFRELASEVRATRTSPHEAYEDQMEHRDRKRALRAAKGVA